jgi:hypothetical protein
VNRRDFELVAQALCDSKPREEDTSYLEQWEWTVEVMAARITVLDMRFSRDTFVKLCGMKEKLKT